MRDYMKPEEKMNYYIPTIWEQTSHGEHQYDIYSRLLKERIVFIDGEINNYVADAVCAQLLFLESQDPERDISVYINSPGGSVVAGLAIYDTIQHIRPEVQTICLGQAASMGALLLTCGSSGKRMALPSTRIMIHQPWGGAEGQATDISIQAKEIVRLKQMLIGYFAKHTGKTEKQITADLERDFYMSAQEAANYGLVDKVLVRDENGKK